MRTVIVSVLAASVLVAAVGLGVSAAFFPLTARVVDAEAGAAVFRARCASCHSLETGGAGRGPGLARVGQEAAGRVPGQDAEEYLLDSMLRPDAYRVRGYEEAAMPANIAESLSDDDLRNLVAFLSAQGGRARPGRVVDLAIQRPEADRGGGTERLQLASVERGRELFLGKGGCNVCHPLRSTSGMSLVAPMLDKVGVYPREDLERALMEPAKQIVKGYEMWAASQDGVTYTGRKMPSPEGRVRLLDVDAKGAPRLLDFAEEDLEELDDEGGRLVRLDISRMPPAGEALNRDEIASLIDFLQTMR